MHPIYDIYAYCVDVTCNFQCEIMGRAPPYLCNLASPLMQFFSFISAICDRSCPHIDTVQRFSQCLHAVPAYRTPRIPCKAAHLVVLQ